MRPIEVFEDNIRRAKNLFSIHKESGRRRPNQVDKDTFRAAVVLAISALDAYVSDMLHDWFIQGLKKQEQAMGWNEETKRFAKRITKKDDILKFMVKARRGKDAVIELLEQQLENESYQNPNQIALAAERLGINDIWTQVDTKLNPKFGAPPPTRLHQISERRNQIVHDADKKNGQLSPLKRKDAEKMVKDVDKIAHAIGDLIESHFARLK